MGAADTLRYTKDKIIPFPKVYRDVYGNTENEEKHENGGKTGKSLYAVLFAVDAALIIPMGILRQFFAPFLHFPPTFPLNFTQKVIKILAGIA